ncbi:TetR/AcrR family transcriptional regulator [Glycomyces xiaoerkulensis]|uniref:TetR/AcrR family transcriptional regulator n=1 Tax=Glycomyces xiaoerkulensis TaxID=2038139 RepID=UPI000C26902D|nr:TetR family transcriptional regulator [Glycomyces xiaoerkulensis]
MTKANDQFNAAARTAAERGRDARTRLLAAAGELIAELGWNAVSTRVLADRAGVRSGLVHYHFDSLQALLRQASTEAMTRVLDQSTAALSTADDPAEAVEATLAELDRYTGTDPESLLFIEAYLAALRDPELHQAIARLFTGFRGALAAALERAGHPDPDPAAALLAASFDGLVLHKGLDPELSASRLAPLVRHIAEPEGPAK